MSLSLTVVTHTDPRRARDLGPCLASVQAALTPACRHVVIPLAAETEDAFFAARYAALQLGEVVAFVDDDDTISPDALRLCLEALADNTLGVAFTDCMIVCTDGVARRAPPCRDYQAICRSPSALHHLAAIRTAYVSDRCLRLARQYQCGIEWLMKAEAALSQGAVRIPHIGYYYVNHPQQQQRTGNPAIRQRYSEAIKPLGEVLAGWARWQGEIGVYGGLARDTED